MMIDVRIPVRPDWQALKDGSNGISYTVANDKGSKAPEYKDEASTGKENPVI